MCEQLRCHARNRHARTLKLLPSASARFLLLRRSPQVQDVVAPASYEGAARLRTPVPGLPQSRSQNAEQAPKPHAGYAVT